MAPFGQHGEGLPPKLLRVAKKIEQRGEFTVRPLDMRHFDDEINRFKRVYNAAWEKNWGFVPLTDAEIDHAEDVSRKIREAFVEFPNWQKSESALRELRKQVTFAIFAETDDLDQVTRLVDELFNLLKKVKRI